MASDFDCALLVPCHNGARFLTRLARSAAAQTRPFREFIVCDDGSTDDTAAVAASLGAKIIRNATPAGPSAARNQLARAASSPWLHFHDADDVLAPRYVEAMAGASSRGASLIICDMRWVAESDGRTTDTWQYNEAAIAAAPIAYFLRHTLGGINGLFQASRFAELGGFNERLHYWEDLDLALRWADSGDRIGVVPEELVIAYRRDDSLSRRDPRGVWHAKLDLISARHQQHGAVIAEAVIAEGEAIATRLLRLGDPVGAQRALSLVEQAGGRVPATGHPALRLASRFMPRLWAFRLQVWHRDRKARTAAP